MTNAERIRLVRDARVLAAKAERLADGGNAEGCAQMCGPVANLLGQAMEGCGRGATLDEIELAKSAAERVSACDWPHEPEHMTRLFSGIVRNDVVSHADQALLLLLQFSAEKKGTTMTGPHFYALEAPYGKNCSAVTFEAERRWDGARKVMGL